MFVVIFPSYGKSSGILQSKSILVVEHFLDVWDVLMGQLLSYEGVQFNDLTLQ
jgi:hypothetical protein